MRAEYEAPLLPHLIGGFTVEPLPDSVNALTLLVNVGAELPLVREDDCDEDEDTGVCERVLARADRIPEPTWLVEEDVLPTLGLLLLRVLPEAGLSLAADADALLNFESRLVDAAEGLEGDAKLLSGFSCPEDELVRRRGVMFPGADEPPPEDRQNDIEPAY